jgi:hypothetical protein
MANLEALAALPARRREVPTGKHAITVTAYDQAGQVLGQVQLGQMP